MVGEIATGLTLGTSGGQSTLNEAPQDNQPQAVLQGPSSRLTVTVVSLAALAIIGAATANFLPDRDRFSLLPFRLAAEIRSPVAAEIRPHRLAGIQKHASARAGSRPRCRRTAAAQAGSATATGPHRQRGAAGYPVVAAGYPVVAAAERDVLGVAQRQLRDTAGRSEENIPPAHSADGTGGCPAWCGRAADDIKHPAFKSARPAYPGIEAGTHASAGARARIVQTGRPCVGRRRSARAFTFTLGRMTAAEPARSKRLSKRHREGKTGFFGC